MATIEDNTQSQNLKSVSHKPGGKPVVIVILVIAALSALVYFFVLNKPKAASNLLELSGRIEGYEVNLGAKIGGRVDMIAHREGESVTKGELLAQISDDDIQAQLRGSEARIERANEQVQSAGDKIGVIQSQIGESDLKISQSQEDSEGKIRQWESTLAMNEARLSQAQSELLQAKADLELAKTRKSRYDFLLSKEAVTKDESDQVSTSFETAKALVAAKEANVVAARKELKACEGQVAQAKSSRLSPRIEGAQKLSLQKQLEQAEHERKQAEHDVQNAQADRDQTKANVAYLKILSPITGVVTARPVEPGAVVVPGQVILSLIDLDKVYMRAFVPEGQIGRVRIGQKAEVYLDAKPNQPFVGKVSQVDPQGSFTPENIYFKDDRIKQVFGIKIEIEQPGGFAKPGMPADAKLVME